MQYKHTSLPNKKSRGSLIYILHYVVVWQRGVVSARAYEDNTAARFVCDETYVGMTYVPPARRDV